MKSKFENFTPIGSSELMETNGGGFSFDVGRVLRFFALSMPGDPASIAYALADWEVRAEYNN